MDPELLASLLRYQDAAQDATRVADGPGGRRRRRSLSERIREAVRGLPGYEESAERARRVGGIAKDLLWDAPRQAVASSARVGLSAAAAPLRLAGLDEPADWLTSEERITEGLGVDAPENLIESGAGFAGYLLPYILAGVGTGGAASALGAGPAATLGAGLAGDFALDAATATGSPQMSTAVQAERWQPEGPVGAGVKTAAEMVAMPFGGLERVAETPALRGLYEGTVGLGTSLAVAKGLPAAARGLKGMGERGSAVLPERLDLFENPVEPTVRQAGLFDGTAAPEGITPEQARGLRGERLQPEEVVPVTDVTPAGDRPTDLFGESGGASPAVVRTLAQSGAGAVGGAAIAPEGHEIEGALAGAVVAGGAPAALRALDEMGEGGFALFGRDLVGKFRQPLKDLSDAELLERYRKYQRGQGRTGLDAESSLLDDAQRTVHSDLTVTSGTGERQAGRYARGRDTQQQARLKAAELEIESRGLEVPREDPYLDPKPSDVLEGNRVLVEGLAGMGDRELHEAIVETAPKANPSNVEATERMALLVAEAGRDGRDVQIERALRGEPPVERPGVAPEFQKAPTPPDARIVGLRKADAAEIRRSLGLDDLPPGERLSMQEAWDEAMERGMAGSASLAAQAAMAAKRGLRPVEHAAAVQRLLELETELGSSRFTLEEAVRAGNDDVVRRETLRSQQILDEFDTLTEAVTRTGSESARSLAARRWLRANADNWTLANGLQQARTAKGAALVPDEVRVIEELSKRIEALDAENLKLRTDVERLAVVKQEQLALAVAETEARQAARAPRGANRLKALQIENVDIKARLAKLGVRLNDLTGVSAEGVYLIGKLAANHIQQAVLQGSKAELQEIVQRVLADLNNPQITARDIYEAMNARSPRAVSAQRRAVHQQIAQLKSQAKALLRLEEAEKGIFPAGTPRPPRNPEIARIEQRIEALRKAAEEPARQARQQANAAAALERRRGALRQTVADAERGVFPEAAARAAPDPEIAKLQARLAELRHEDDLRTRVAEAEQGRFPARRPKPVSSAAIQKLRDRLRDLRTAAYASSADQRRLELTLQTINDLEDQLANHVRKPFRGKPRPIPSEELHNLQTRVKGLRQEMRVEDRLADLEHQLQTGEFKVPVPRETLYTSPALERNQIALKKAKQQWRDAIRSFERPTGRQKLAAGADFLRTVRATADMSATLRQGLWLSTSRPRTAMRAFGQSARAFFSSATADQIDNAIRQHPNQLMRDMAGLQLADLDGPVSKREEMFASKLAERIPVFGEMVRASNRSMTTTLNLLRTAAFDEFVTKFPNATSDELKAWANWVNVASGRGDLGPLKAIGTELSAVVFAPRFTASRIQTPFMVLRHWQEPRVRKMIARDYAATVGLGLSALTLADLAGLSVGVDPRDSDFGKIRFDDTRIDLWGGVQQPVRLIARAMLQGTDRVGLTGEHLRDFEKQPDPLGLIGQFAQFKLAPSVTMPLELWTGRTAVGEPTTPTATAVRSVLPLLWEDVYETYRLAGPEAAAASAGLNFLGASTQTFGDSENVTRRKIRQSMMAGDQTAARQMLAKWNRANPTNPIRQVR